MKKLTTADLLNLKFSDRVYRKDSNGFRQLRYVGRMPGAPDAYLIFCEGTYLTYLFIDPKDGGFLDKWFSGHYDRPYILTVEINEAKKHLEELQLELLELTKGDQQIN